MARRLDWEAENRRKRARRFGTEYAYWEIHPADSPPSRSGFSDAAEKMNSPKRRLLDAGQRREKKARNQQRTLAELVDISRTPKWNERGKDYQMQILQHVRSLVNKLRKSAPSDLSDTLMVEANRLLDENAS